VRATVRAHDAAFREMTTPHLTRALEQALQAHQPPLVRGRRIKLRYAHQGGKNPPRIIVHGNQTTSVPEAYRRYLANVFRKTFDLLLRPSRWSFAPTRTPTSAASAARNAEGHCGLKSRVRGTAPDQHRPG